MNIYKYIKIKKPMPGGSSRAETGMHRIANWLVSVVVTIKW